MYSYLFIPSCFAVSLLMGSVILPRVLLVSLRKRLFDAPDARKVHRVAVSRLGGVAFFPSVLFSVCLVFSLCCLTGQAPCPVVAGMPAQLLLPVCGLTLLYLTGIADDLVGVRYRTKFLVQTVSASLLPLSGLWMNDLYGFMGIHALPEWTGIPLTVFTVVFITNAINLIDGIDGLAAGLSLVSLGMFGWLFIAGNLFVHALIAFASLGVLVPFLYFNVWGRAERGRKIFMGDTGSFTLGYILAFLAVRYVRNEPEVMPPAGGGTLVIAFATLIVPAFDVVRVALLRLRRGQGLFLPDRNHVHHKFLAMGFTPRRALVLILSLSSLFGVTNILLVPYINSTWLVTADVAVWMGLNLFWDRKITRNNLTV